MRWLVTQPGPEFSVQDVYAGWVEALQQLGEQVATFNLGQQLAFFGNALMPDGDPAHAGPAGTKAVKFALSEEESYAHASDALAARLWSVKPDVLLVCSGFFIPHELLDHARHVYGTRVVVLHTEQPYELDRELSLAAHADLNLINDPTHLAQFEAVAPTVYAHHAYRPTIHYPGPGKDHLRCDFAFVGTGFGSRRWFFEELQKSGVLAERDVLLAGHWHQLPEDHPLRPWIAAESPEQCVDNDETAEIYRSTKASINIYRREANDGVPARGLSMGPREVELAACRTFFLRDRRPEGDQLFPMLPTFTGPGEAAELLAWWLDSRHDTQREAAAAGAREAIAGRTFLNSATQLLRMFGRAPVAHSTS